MDSKPILILGGYGGTGKILARSLLKETGLKVAIAGRNLAKAQELVARLSVDFPTRVTARVADASDKNSLTEAFRGIRMVIVASTTTQFTDLVARTAIEAGIDYFDYHYDQRVIPVLNALQGAIEKAGRCFITQGGFHPGLPAAFVRFAAPRFDRYRKAIIGMAMNARIEMAESVYELIDALGEEQIAVFRDGAWRQGTYKDMKSIDLGPMFGTRSCYPIRLEEMQTLPEMFGIEETGVYVAGFNRFVDYCVFLPGMLLYKIRKGLGRRLLARLLVWGINTFSPQKSGVAFVLEAAGEKGEKPVALRIFAEHEDPYTFTVIPVVACLLQYLDGSIAKPGLRMMAHAVDPGRLMMDMGRMGVRISGL